jgi:hypothetical protein
MNYKEQEKIIRSVVREQRLERQKMAEDHAKKFAETHVAPPRKKAYPKERCDHPNTIEDSTATVFWIAAMIISLLFKGGWAMCILETIAWWKFISRYK